MSAQQSTSDASWHDPVEVRTLLDSGEIARALSRIAHEVLERTKGGDDVVLLGIPTRGVFLARRIAARMTEIEGREVPAGDEDQDMLVSDEMFESQDETHILHPSSRALFRFWETMRAERPPSAFLPNGFCSSR